MLQDQTDHDDIDILFQGFNGANLINNALISTDNNFLNFETYNDSPMKGLIYKTKSTEAMRIDNNQNVGIGATIPQAKLDIAGDLAFTTATSTIKLQAPSW